MIDKKIKAIKLLLKDEMFKHSCKELDISCIQCEYTIMEAYLKQWLDRLFWDKDNN